MGRRVEFFWKPEWTKDEHPDQNPGCMRLSFICITAPYLNRDHKRELQIHHFHKNVRLSLTLLLHVFIVGMFKNLQNIASFAQLQSKSINICLFSIKFPILVKINATIIKILLSNKWSSKIYSFQKHRPTFHEVDSDVIIDCSPSPWDCRETETETETGLFASTSNKQVHKLS